MRKSLWNESVKIWYLALSISKLQFPHLWNGIIITCLIWLFWGLNKMIHRKVLACCLTQSECHETKNLTYPTYAMIVAHFLFIIDPNSLTNLYLPGWKEKGRREWDAQELFLPSRCWLNLFLSGLTVNIISDSTSELFHPPYPFYISMHQGPLGPIG